MVRALTGTLELVCALCVSVFCLSKSKCLCIYVSLGNEYYEFFPDSIQGSKDRACRCGAICKAHQVKVHI